MLVSSASVSLSTIERKTMSYLVRRLLELALRSCWLNLATLSTLLFLSSPGRRTWLNSYCHRLGDHRGAIWRCTDGDDGVTASDHAIRICRNQHAKNAGKSKRDLPGACPTIMIGLADATASKPRKTTAEDLIMARENNNENTNRPATRIQVTIGRKKGSSGERIPSFLMGVHCGAVMAWRRQGRVLRWG